MRNDLNPTEAAFFLCLAFFFEVFEVYRGHTTATKLKQKVT